jgi:excisionase family DNA binding protein
MMMLESLMTVEALSEYLGVPKATVFSWNSRGVGPRRYRVGKHVRYRRADVDAWLMEQVAPTYGVRA